MIILSFAISIMFYAATLAARFYADTTPDDDDAFALGDCVRIIGPDVDGDLSFRFRVGYIEAGNEADGVVYVHDISGRWATNVLVDNLMLVERL